MIPLRDAIPAQSFPAATVLLIALNVLAFLYELSLGRALDVFIMQYGAVPLRFVLAGQMEQVSTVERFLPLITSMFLHGGWLHLGGNMLYLWIFGDNVEDRVGHGLHPSHLKDSYGGGEWGCGGGVGSIFASVSVCACAGFDSDSLLFSDC
jgi:membrane associated rhomboid family serine protease